jgi:hypothetical protein
MTPLLLALALQAAAAQVQHAACVYWTQPMESRAALEKSGVRHICVPPEQREAWRAAGFDANGLTREELDTRVPLPAPGVAPRTGVASPTRAPWIVANGWRIVRDPSAKYVYQVPAGRGALAAAEAVAYGADAVLQIDPADLEPVGAVMSLADSLAPANLPSVADIAVVDDGTAATGEVMNLLERRNLLFAIVKTPSPRYPINIALGSREYPVEDAADPSAFALAVRRRLTDEKRSLRVFGSEVVVCRLLSDGSRARLYLINYGGREVQGLRLRMRGAFRGADAQVAGAGRVALDDQSVANGATEFSLPRLTTYAVVDLNAVR